MKKRGRPPKPGATRSKIQLYADEPSFQLLEAIAEQRGRLSQSSLVRLLIHEEAERRGIRIGAHAEDKEPALIG